MIPGRVNNQSLSISSENLSLDLFLISTSEDFPPEKIQKMDMLLLGLEGLPNLILINVSIKGGFDERKFSPESGLPTGEPSVDADDLKFAEPWTKVSKSARPSRFGNLARCHISVASMTIAGILAKKASKGQYTIWIIFYSLG